MAAGAALIDTLRSICLFAVLIFSAVSATARGDTILDTGNVNFTRDGHQFFTPAPGGLTLTDTSSADFVGFFANDGDAQAGHAIDLVATFQLLQTVPNNVDTGLRLVINDGIETAAILGGIYVDLDPGPFSNFALALGLAAGTNFSDPASWPAFTIVDLTNPTSVRLRRTAAGDTELIELNGAPPPNPVFLPKASLPPKTRAGATVEFGLFSLESEGTVVFTELYSETVVPEPATATLLTIGIGGLLVAARRRLKAASRK
jgi:hypothetical protein